MAVDIKIVVKELLKKNPCVILPRLGGFTAEYASAKVDPNSNTFNPPRKKLGFNPDLTNDGGLIHGYLIKEKGFSENEANKVLADFVQQVWRRLDHGLEENFPNIGTLKLNEKKVIEFESATDENLLLESYGFDSFKYSPSNTSKKTPAIEQPRVKRPSFARALIFIVGIPLLITYGVYFYMEGDPVPFRSLFTNDSVKDFTLDEYDAFLSGDKNDTTTNEEYKELDKKLDHQTRPENALKYTEDPASTREKPVADKYAGMTEFHIIAGSFKKMSNARVLSQKLVTKGFQPTILDKQNGYFRVSIKSFDNRTIALQEFNRLRSKHRDLKLWLLSM